MVSSVKEVRGHILKTAAPEVALQRFDKGQFFLFKTPNTRVKQACRYNYCCSCFTRGVGTEAEVLFFCIQQHSASVLCDIDLRIPVSCGNKALRYSYRHKWYTAATCIVLLLGCNRPLKHKMHTENIYNSSSYVTESTLHLRYVDSH